MKQMLLSLTIILLTGIAQAANPEVRISCVNGVHPPYGEEVVKSLTLNLNYAGGVMSGLAGFRGDMIVEYSGGAKTAVDVYTSPKWHDVKFYGENENTFSLDTNSDIFDSVGMKRIAELTQSQSSGWKKTFKLICERVM